MATPSELAQIQHILGKRRNSEQNPLDLSARKKSREYLDSHKDVEKRRRDRINTCLDTIRTLVPLCHQLPRHRRVDKADLLDLAIIYLRMVNQFLEKIGVSDIFSAAHQQLALFTSLEKWVKDEGDQHADVPSFTKQILAFVEKEKETASHVIASEQTSGHTRGEGTSQQNSDWIKSEIEIIEDGSSYPHPCPRSASDEERSPSCHGDKEDRGSGSENSSGIGSPVNLTAAGEGYPRDQHAFSQEESTGLYQCNGHESSQFTSRRSTTNGFHSVCASYFQENVSKPVCVDKAVNTDACPASFTWSPDGTFTLPIISGKIVLHSGMSTSETGDHTAPAGVRAEIHTSPDTKAPCPSDCRCSRDDHQGPPDGNNYHKIPPPEQKCVTQRQQADTNVLLDPTVQHASDFVPYVSQRYPAVEIVVPVPNGRYSREDVGAMERHRRLAYRDESYGPGIREEKSYAPLVPLRHAREDRAARYPSPQSSYRPVEHREIERTLDSQKNGPFSKRYLAGLGTQHSDDSSNDSGVTENKSYRCCPTSSSALKLKSMMVHRHQLQHKVISR